MENQTQTQTKTKTVKAPKKVAAAKEAVVVEQPAIELQSETTEEVVVEESSDNVEQLLQMFNSLLENMKNIDEFMKTTSTIPTNSKEFTTVISTKLPKAFATMQGSLFSLCAKTIDSQTKELNKKQKNKKSTDQKKDTSNSHLYKSIPVEEFMREFIKSTDKFSKDADGNALKELPNRDEISRMDAQKAVYNWIDNNYPVVDSKRPEIKVAGELKTLFTHIDKVMKTRLHTLTDEVKKMEKAKETVSKKLLDACEKVKKHIERRKTSDVIVHTNVMEYNTYCFPKDKLW